MSLYTLNKKERLKSRLLIKSLFDKGQSFGAYPLRWIWLRVEESENQSNPILFTVSVAKRKFPKAVQRNAIKRLVREAYRLHKPALLQKIPKNSQYALMVLYVAKEKQTFEVIEKAMKKAVIQFEKQITKA